MPQPTEEERLSRSNEYLGKDRDELREIIVARDIKLERIADWIRKVNDGDSSIDGAFIEIEAICNE